ncbi:hypothetical protein [Streptomyces sp. 1222.5]|uniref:hypothetical protein n=1 Tax=Streptomyces sp. 1222.5 TaxID=1881026 RepID=UPI003EC14D07
MSAITAKADGEAYEGELAMYRGLFRTLRVVVRPDDAELGEVRRLLYQHASDDAAARAMAERTNTSVSTPAPRDRQQILLARIRAERGEWTTQRAVRTFRGLGIKGLFRGSVRSDLAALQRAGHLVLHDEDPGRRFYTYTTKGGAQ